MVRFRIVTTSYNCSEYLDRCLSSLEQQTHQNFTACIIDDASTDPNQRPIIEAYCNRNGWQSIFNATNRQGMATMIQAIDAQNCEDEDVIVILDGDDWLYNENVLEHVKRVYIEQDCLITSGQLIRASDGSLGVEHPINPRWIRKRSYRRESQWMLNHLRTFKYLLWRHIRDEDLRDVNGRYLSRASDRATMYPMAEMAGDRIVFIPEILYVYNDLNPLNDCKLYTDVQVDDIKHVASLPRYKPLKGP